MIPSLEGWPTKAEETPSPHEVRLTPLDINPVFQCNVENVIYVCNLWSHHHCYSQPYLPGKGLLNRDLRTTGFYLRFLRF